MDSQLHCILLQGCDWRHLVRINWFLGKYQSPVEKSIPDHVVIDLTLYILYVVHFKDKLVSKLFVKLFLKFGRDSKLIHCLRL